VIRVVLDRKSVPLDLGQAVRVVTATQREALIIRDHGCAFPGCHLPARWTDAHHIIHWKDGGPTDLDNLVLLCRRHHTLLHKSEWQIQVVDRIPYFQPPRWVDPEQKLIRNILRQ
jgi:predicted restriction endonuclease